MTVRSAVSGFLWSQNLTWIWGCTCEQLTGSLGCTFFIVTWVWYSSQCWPLRRLWDTNGIHQRENGTQEPRVTVGSSAPNHAPPQKKGPGPVLSSTPLTADIQYLFLMIYQMFISRVLHMHVSEPSNMVNKIKQKKKQQILIKFFPMGRAPLINMPQTTKFQNYSFGLYIVCLF